MKTSKIIAIAATVVALAACSKENTTIDSPSEGTTFQKGQAVTIGVSSSEVSTKVTGTDDGTNINLVWEEGDEILVTVGDASATFTLASGEGSSTATFTGEMPAEGSTFDIQYPAQAPDLSSQNYMEGKIPTGKLSFSATGCTLGKTADLTATNSILHLKLYGKDKTISKIVVTNASSSATYTLNISGGITLGTTSETATPCYIVVPKGEYKISAAIYDNAATPAQICEFTTSTNQMFGEENEAGKCINMPAKEVKGKPVFSVSATKKVQFTAGNLWWGKKSPETTADWHLEESQTAFPTSWDTDHVGHFYWTKTAAASYAASFNDGELKVTDMFFADGRDVAHTLTVEEQSNLYVLSSAEWTYLLSSTSDGGRGDGDSYFKKGVTVNGVANCLVIAPDGYTGSIVSSYDAATWSAAESDGLVCLPAAGCRNNTSWFNAYVNGRYLSATPYESFEYTEYCLYFENGSVNPSEDCSRNWGYSVRLVCTVSE